MAAEKTCLVIGAGAGIGGSVGKKFAAEGYHAALCRRSDIDGLNTMVSGLQEAGMSASGHLLNAVDEGALEGLIEEVEAIGPIDTVLTISAPRSVTAPRRYASRFRTGLADGVFWAISCGKGIGPTDGRAGSWHDSSDFGHGGGSRQQRPALSHRSDGRTSSPVPEPERRVRSAGCACGAYSH